MHVIDLQVSTDKHSRGAFRLYGIGDPHLDKRTHDGKRFRRYLDHIAADPNSVAICVGDVFDVTLPSHKFYDASTQRADVVAMMDVYVNKMVEEAVDLFAPILKAGIPFVCAEGNHDIRLHGVNAIMLLVAQLNDRAKSAAWRGRAHYAGGEALIRVRAPIPIAGATSTACFWTVYLNHGTGSGMQPGAKINRATWQAHIADADIYLRGHVEEGDVRIVERYAVTKKGPARLIARPVAYYTAAGHATQRIEGVVDYAGRKALPPVDRRIKWLHIKNAWSGEALGAAAQARSHGEYNGGRITEVEANW